MDFRLKKTLVVFDFDGTLADSFQLFLKTFDAASEIYGFRPFDRDKMDVLRAMEASEVLKHHGVRFWQLPAIARTTRLLMTRGIGGVNLVEGLDATLQWLHQTGCDLAILTSNSRANVESVLGRELCCLFTHFECGVSIFTKDRALTKVIRTIGCRRDETLLIGDEIRDLKAAKMVGVSFGAVAWGYNSLECLVAHGADETFHSPRDLAVRYCGIHPSVQAKAVE
jgi:phosphoglycolate phosphatase